VTHFALTDAAGIAVAFLLCPVFTLFPGYLLAHLSNLWQFRTRTSAFQLAASTVLAVSIGPIFTFLLGSISNWKVVWIVYLCIAAASLTSLRPRFNKTSLIAISIAVAWSLFAALWLMDWQFNTRVYTPIYSFDNGTRAAFIHALATFGLPAQSPFFYPGHPVALHYHFLWLLQPALIHWLLPSLISARMALIAAAIWASLSVMCLAALTTKIFTGRASYFALALLALSGIDLIPSYLGILPTRMHLTDLLQTAYWQPHYACALVACFTGFLVLWQTRRLVLCCLAALCFATAAGSGSFVTLVFAAFLMAWILCHIRESLPLVFTGVLSILIALPYLLTLRGATTASGLSAWLHFIWSPFAPLSWSPVIQLITLPVYYFAELGFLVAAVRKKALNERMLCLLLAVTLVLCSFIESAATPNNDLGWRGLMLAQFALAILAAKSRRTPILTVLLAFGLLGTAYDFALNRFFPILSDMHAGSKPPWLGPDQNLGARTYANREAYAWLQVHSSPASIIGQNPNLDFIDVSSGLYGDRRIIAGDRTCTNGFGGSSKECAPLVNVLTKVFNGQTELSAACPTLPGTLYIVKDTDPGWRRPNSWIWRQPPIFANQFVRIFSCATSNVHK
jgi:hypothetical protein